MPKQFTVDAAYSRADIQTALGVPSDKRKGGDWATGYTKYEHQYFVFATVGGAGRTGHDYDNYWDGDELVWSAKAGSKLHQPQVEELIGGKLPVHVFWREGDRSPFIYAGEGQARFVEDTSPVKVVWAFLNSDDALSPAPEMLRIRWTEGQAEGYTDQFAAGEFDDECFREARSHEVISPSGELFGQAKYLLTIHHRRATLDYSAFAEENKKAGMVIGIAIFEFGDDDRSLLRQVYWKSSPDGEETEAAARKQTYEALTPANYEPPPPGTPIKRDMVRRKERKGQRRFRVQLRRVYGNKCCITGCSAPEALEAAHIDQHINATSDVPSNGLLLRRDIHALFDRDLIGITPQGDVVLAETMMGRNHYIEQLEGARIAEPDKGFKKKGYLPSELALAIRWEQFQNAQQADKKD